VDLEVGAEVPSGAKGQRPQSWSIFV